MMIRRLVQLREHQEEVAGLLLVRVGAVRALGIEVLANAMGIFIRGKVCNFRVVIFF
jgi:hypothetical protein